MAKTYFHSTTALATGLHVADFENELRTVTEAPVAQVSANIAGATDRIIWASTTGVGEPGVAGWGTGTYSCEMDCTAIGVDVTFGLLTVGGSGGHFARVDSALAVEVDTVVQAQAAFSGTGLKLATAFWTPAGATQTDRFEIAIAAGRPAGGGNQTITLELGDTDAEVVGPWTFADAVPATAVWTALAASVIVVAPATPATAAWTALPATVLIPTTQFSKVTLGYAYLPVVQTSPTGTIFIAKGVTAVADTTEGEAVHLVTDPAQRPLFLQDTAERSIGVGGCETNQELRIWDRRHEDHAELRGTTTGIRLAVQRMTCTDRVVVLLETRPGEWFLEVTYPEVTPIFLEFVGVLRTVVVEFQSGAAPNWSAQRLADWIVEVLVPKSVVEMVYQVAVATRLTAATTTVGGNTRITVESTADFPVGASVTIRNGANTRREATTVLAVVSPTQVDVTILDSSFFTFDVLRRVLATS